MDPEPGALVFGDDGLHVFRSVAEAAGCVEAIDVEAGEYEAFFTTGGQRLTPHVRPDGIVTLNGSGGSELEVLRRLLRREQQERGGFVSDPADPVGVANEVLQELWDKRWPKWPRWLDLRLHGDSRRGRRLGCGCVHR